MNMPITAESLVSDVAVALPATIAIFQARQIDFCCGGRIPIAEACASRGLDADRVVEELRAAGRTPSVETDWEREPLAAIIEHIQARYHVPLRPELGRLEAMLAKAVNRHGHSLPETLLPLQATFATLQAELLAHMAREDAVLFPAIVASEAALANGDPNRPWQVIAAAVAVMEDEHASAGAALATMRTLTRDYTPPEWACPTFRGLYYGLAALESTMHLHVHLENHVLFPRAARLAEALSLQDASRPLPQQRRAG
jgi:regulator of cell morphogenesis and NO signaling